MLQPSPRPSFSPLAYGHMQACRLTGAADHQAELISIGSRTARVLLRAQADSMFRFGEDCLLGLLSTSAGQVLWERPGKVAWMNGCEAGVEFHARLDISILSLQQAIGIAP